MSVTINSVSGDFEIESAVTLSGTAEPPVTAVTLLADDSVTIGVVPVAGGKWSFSRIFHSPGDRKITANGMDQANAVVASAVTHVVVRAPLPSHTARRLEFTIGVRKVYTIPPSSALFYVSGMAIDADGSPHAYHPESAKGLDDLRNAMDSNGRFVGVVTRDNGAPVVQKAGDPAPGFFVSPTTLTDHTIVDQSNPLRYVNSETVPYVVVSGAPPMRSRVSLGDLAAVYYGKTGKIAFAICADIGPKTKLGEGSIALAKALGIHPSARIGGTDSGVMYVLFAGSRALLGKPWTHTEAQSVVDERAHKHLEEWGGMARLNACFSDLA